MLPAPAALPGRPERPALISPAQVPQRSVHSVEGRAALIHAICHIEFNAINLALDAVWRFGGMPEDFYRDWLRVAVEEAYHFSLLHTHLQTLGNRYGDFPAHDGLWAMCEKTQDDITARMALVPRTLEARGLDATPLIQTKLRAVGTPDALAACDILGIIHRDESVQPVAVGIDRLRAETNEREVVTSAYAGHEIPNRKHIVARSLEDFLQNSGSRFNSLTRGSTKQQIIHPAFPFQVKFLSDNSNFHTFKSI